VQTRTSCRADDAEPDVDRVDRHADAGRDGHDLGQRLDDEAVAAHRGDGVYQPGGGEEGVIVHGSPRARVGDPSFRR
jgi:hypothetical protein